jgi:hypothetical protein
LIAVKDAKKCPAAINAARLEPVEEVHRRPRIGVPRVRVADLRGEEFKETVGRARAGCGDKGRSAVGEGDELGHQASSFCNRLKARIDPSTILPQDVLAYTLIVFSLALIFSRGSKEIETASRS